MQPDMKKKCFHQLFFGINLMILVRMYPSISLYRYFKTPALVIFARAETSEILMVVGFQSMNIYHVTQNYLEIRMFAGVDEEIYGTVCKNQ